MPARTAAEPQSWLLEGGWKRARHGLLSIAEVPVVAGAERMAVRTRRASNESVTLRARSSRAALGRQRRANTLLGPMRAAWASTDLRDEASSRARM